MVSCPEVSGSLQGSSCPARCMGTIRRTEGTGREQLTEPESLVLRKGGMVRAQVKSRFLRISQDPTMAHSRLPTAVLKSL